MQIDLLSLASKSSWRLESIRMKLESDMALKEAELSNLGQRIQDQPETLESLLRRLENTSLVDFIKL